MALADLVERWFGLHGQSLCDGEQRKSKLLLICESLGNPLAREFTGNDFAKYREARLSGAVSVATVNRDHAYLRRRKGRLEYVISHWRSSPGS